MGAPREALLSRTDTVSRGETWFQVLTCSRGLMAGFPTTIRTADALLGRENARFIAVVADAENRFPRARSGEIGLDEGWTLSAVIRDTIAHDYGKSRRPIIAIVDVSSQAYGRLEEQLGLHLACAAAVDAYATARLAGHPVIALLVGKAMSGAFLAHGYQANRMIALDDPGVIVHAMGQASAARITRRETSELAGLAENCPPMAYDIKTYAQWGLLHALLPDVEADQPRESDLERVRAALIAAIEDTRAHGSNLSGRLTAGSGSLGRPASRLVREHLKAQWDG